MILLNDYLLLGTAVPEPDNRDHLLGICSAGVSPTLGMVRVTPLALVGAPKRWSINRVPLERDPRDNRPESWRIEGDLPTIHPLINRKFEQVGKLDTKQHMAVLQKLTAPFFVETVQEAIDRGMSLALMNLDPGDIRLMFNEYDEFSPLKARSYDDLAWKSKERFRYHPRLQLKAPDTVTGHRNLALRDWGAFEWMRKEGDHRRHEIEKNLYLHLPRTLFIGNMVRGDRRKSFIVISVLTRIEPKESNHDHRAHRR